MEEVSRNGKFTRMRTRKRDIIFFSPSSVSSLLASLLPTGRRHIKYIATHNHKKISTLLSKFIILYWAACGPQAAGLTPLAKNLYRGLNFLARRAKNCKANAATAHGSGLQRVK